MGQILHGSDKTRYAVRTAEGKLYLFVVIDRTSKYAFVQLVKKAGKMAAGVSHQRLLDRYV